MRRVAASALLVLVITAGIAACSGDDSNDNAQPTNVDDTTDAGSTTTTPPNTAGLTPDLGNILDRQKDAVIRITYQHGDDTFTIAQDHDRRAITSGTSMSIVTPKKSVDCSNIDTKPTCLEVPEGVSSLVSIGLIFYDAVAQGIAAAGDADPPIKTTKETIAGRDAVCAEGDAATFLAQANQSIGRVPSGTVRACVDAETGYLLEYSSGDAASDKLIATSVRKATDADFDPPAPVQGF